MRMVARARVAPRVAQQVEEEARDHAAKDEEPDNDGAKEARVLFLVAKYGGVFGHEEPPVADVDALKVAK